MGFWNGGSPGWDRLKVKKSERPMTAIRTAMAFIPAQLTHFRGWKLTNQRVRDEGNGVIACHCQFLRANSQAVGIR